MPINRPPMLRLGGEAAFAAYQGEFDRLYRSGPVVDVLGNRVSFTADACRHVCFKSQAEDPYQRLARIWAQERAERIPWILAALTDPGTEVRPNFQRRDRFSYILVVEAVPALGLPQEYFGVVTEPVGPRLVEFVTGFPFAYERWARWRDGGAPLYPFRPRLPKKPKKPRR